MFAAVFVLLSLLLILFISFCYILWKLHVLYLYFIVSFALILIYYCYFVLAVARGNGRIIIIATYFIWLYFLNFMYYIYIYIVSFHLYVYLFIIAISSVIDVGYLIDSMNGHIIIIATYLIYFTTRPIFIFYYYMCTCIYLLLAFRFWLMLAIWSDCCWWQRSERHLPEGVPGGRGLVAVEFVSGFTETDDTRRTMGNECRCKPKGWNDQVRRNATSPPSVSLVTDIRATDNK